jgi:hypothetical protein
MFIADLMPLGVGYRVVLFAVGHVPIVSEVLHDLYCLKGSWRQPQHQERHQHPLEDPEEPCGLTQSGQQGGSLDGHQE